MKKRAKASTKPRPKSLRAELDLALRRLDEAEQTLDAIRAGHVDALVVAGTEGPRIFTLQGADHRYRRIVEEMTEGAAIVNPDGIILYANAAFARLVLSPLDRVLGSRLREHAVQAAGPAIDRLLRSARHGTVSVDTDFVAGPGLVRVHVSAAPDSEQQDAVCVIVTDLRGTMQQEEQRFKFVADMLPQIIWSARPDGVLDYCNRRWFEFTGTTLEEARGSWESIVHPDDAAAHVEKWTRSIRTGEPFEIATRLKRGWDGVYRWHLARATPQRDAEGEVLKWYGSSTDIEDERALVAEAERARDKAEEATRLKDEFLATLSHELRTPLNAILGWSRLLQVGSLAEERRQPAIDSVVRNAKAQNQLIDDLLDVSRIVSGKLLLSVGPVSMNEVIEAALDVVRPAADAKAVRLQAILDAEAGQISGDPGRLQQVIWNLLANAVKFTPKGGCVHIRLQREESAAEISVADTGVGISAEFLPYVFDRFRQQDGSITRRAGGLGLGLAIVKSIVELHGGTVQAHSNGTGTGATFVVRLPITPLRSTISSLPPASAPRRPEPLAREPADLQGLKVLVVDDEVDTRELLQVTLERFGAAVVTAASVVEAMSVVRRLKPDVIVSDIGMPSDDGYTFLRQLRALPLEEGGRIPAVALTAYARSEDRARALLAGFQSHTAKPVDPTELVAVIAHLAGRYS